MFKQLKKNRQEGKNIILLADCIQGVMRAAEFAVKYLYDRDSKIILLQTYQNPSFGVTMIRNISVLLRKIGKMELTEMKDRLMERFGLPGSKIEKILAEGDVRKVLNSKLFTQRNTSVLLGFESEINHKSASCRKVITKLLQSGVRPVFLVSDCITVIEEHRVFLIATDEKKLSFVFLNLIKSLCNENNMNLKFITGDNREKAGLSAHTFRQFSEPAETMSPPESPVEKILYEQILAENHME